MDQLDGQTFNGLDYAIAAACIPPPGGSASSIVAETARCFFGKPRGGLVSLVGFIRNLAGRYISSCNKG